jgi:histidinol dehydrogenase
LPAELLRVDTVEDAGPAAARIRALVPGGGHVAEGVAALIADVRTRGDAALAEHAARFDRADGAPFAPLVVPDGDLDAAVAALDDELRAALLLAIDNVAAVSRATVHEDRDVELPQGQLVRVREVPVRRAAVYVPGGRAPYPSTAIMGVVAARAAGVDEVVVATPSDDPVLRAACRLAGADRVYRMGGAHGVAALARCGSTSWSGPATCGSRRPSGSSPGSSASTASRGPATCSCSRTGAPTRTWPRSTWAPRPSTATARSSSS